MNESNIQQLIEEVQSRPFLWDKTIKEFQNKTKKGQEWNKIAANLKQSKTAIQNKWQSLLRTFRAEHALVNNLRSGDGLEDVYKSSWTYYEPLRFLTKSSVANVSSGNLNFIFDIEPSLKTEPKNQESLNMSKKNNPLADQLLNMENKKLSLLEKSLNNNKSSVMNERDKLHMSYFETLLPSLREISDQDILVCRNDISEIVFRYAYKGAAWKSLNQHKVESVRGNKRKIDEDDDCQIVSYIPPPAQLNQIMKIKEEKEDKYLPTLSERQLERRNYSESTIMPWLGRHARAHVSSTPPYWNNRDCHSRSSTPRPCSSRTITHAPSNVRSGTSLTGGDYYSHRAITPNPSATVTRPPSNLHSRTPVTGGDHGRGTYQQTENVDYFSHRAITPQYSPVTVTRPRSNLHSGTPLTGDLGRGTYQQTETVDYFSHRAIPPQYPSPTVTCPSRKVAHDITNSLLHHHKNQFVTQNDEQPPAVLASKENEPLRSGNNQETVADLSESQIDKDH